eukprot:CAMPEP_0118840730 /NCGR_PEP_ID=MMETSP1162-20130426/73885_1 /TAXON_ID=33656 /ORGANISM="Phaeocystis Sp, Strain CCMP2710" /LENGTH=67 /DNA_ID=CAMNT_0006772753 /DNA_START=133 /DNA_END=332 /DNA_ORIENTATION=+
MPSASHHGARGHLLRGQVRREERKVLQRRLPAAAAAAAAQPAARRHVGTVARAIAPTVPSTAAAAST